MVPLPSVTLLATGGTMSCTTDASGALVPSQTAEHLSQDAGLGPDRIRPLDTLHLDSSEMSLSDLDRLLAAVHREVVQGHRVIVTHGTDSMEESAMAVDRLIDAPVVFTGAQRPADDPAPDGPGNLRFALETLETPRTPTTTRPTVVMGGAIIPAYGARKVHTTADRAFAAPGDIHRPAPLLSPGTPPVPLAGLRVDIVTAYQGADSTLVDAALAAGADGLVIAAFGSGNAGGLAPGVRRALGAGIPVVICTRVPEGPVAALYGGPGGGATLAATGARSGHCLSPAQARMELLCQLAVSRRDCPTDQPG